MSKKIAAASIVALFIGGAAIPGGIFVNDMILGMVEEFVSDGFLGIEEEAVPMIEPMLNDMAIPIALDGVRDTGLDLVEEMVNDTFTAFIIDTIMNGISMEMALVIKIDGIAATNDQFFNQVGYTFVVTVKLLSTQIGILLSFEGVGNYLDENLGFNSSGADRILNGNHTSNPDSPYYIPGILQDLDMGTGCTDFLALYDAAHNDSTPEGLEMMNKYDCSWEQLTKFVDYIRNYIMTVAIPDVIDGAEILGFQIDILEQLMPELAGVSSIREIAERYFYDQWANCGLIEEGMDFAGIVEGIEGPLYGFEVGRETPSEISLASAMDLFNNDIPTSLTSDDGINSWIEARDEAELEDWEEKPVQEELMETFGITQEQMDMILYWLFEESFRDNIVPVLMELPPPDGVGMNLTAYSRVLLLEVWCNGTAVGRALYPYGFPFPLGEKTVFGFEVGYQSETVPVIPTGMSLESAEALWDPDNPYSLTNKDGLALWWQAVANPSSEIADDLQAANGLEENAMGMLLEYLPKFRDNVMPHLAQYVMGLPVDTTTLGGMIQIGGIGLGAVLIGLASTGFIGNRYIKVNRRRLELGPQRIGYPNRKKVLPPSTEYKRVWNPEFGHYEYKKK